MRKVQYTYWKDGEFYIGYLNDYPDYQTSKEELLENLFDLLNDIEEIFFSIRVRNNFLSKLQ